MYSKNIFIQYIVTAIRVSEFLLILMFYKLDVSDLAPRGDWYLSVPNYGSVWVDNFLTRNSLISRSVNP